MPVSICENRDCMPYAGSGTTIIAAIEEGFTAFGSDLEQHHCDIFNLRVRHGIQPKMF